MLNIVVSLKLKKEDEHNKYDIIFSLFLFLTFTIREQLIPTGI